MNMQKCGQESQIDDLIVNIYYPNANIMALGLLSPSSRIMNLAFITRRLNGIHERTHAASA